jgi:hypothetical protein
MSNPTTPFGWQMPENTDLVTDLPADFEVFGQAVATSMQDLLGGTTGQVLAKASNTDMDFVWSADAAGMTNPMTTTGDVIYSSPGSTPVRLGIGSTGNILTVAGGVPTWAAPAGGGGMTVLASGSITNTTLSITSINQTYTNLFLYLNLENGAAGAYGAEVRLNSNSSSVYNNVRNALINGSAVGGASQNETAFRLQSDFFITLSNFQMGMTIYGYTNTDPRKIVNYNSLGLDQSSNAPLVTNAGGSFNSATAITSIQTTTNMTGSYILYGVK